MWLLRAMNDTVGHGTFRHKQYKEQQFLTVQQYGEHDSTHKRNSPM